MESTVEINPQNESSLKDSKDDSGFFNNSFENQLLLSNEEEHQSLTELNNRFARYIEHIRQQELTAKSNLTIEELAKIPSIQLENLKSLYDSEMRNLRDALDKQSNELASMTIKNNKLLAKNENINRELEEKQLQIQQLTESFQKSESENSYLKIQIQLLQKNRDLAENLSDQLKTCQEQLEVEVLLRTAADNACLTYKEKMEFNEAVFRKELGALKMANKSILASMTTLKNDITSSNLFQQMEDARNRLREYLDDFRNLIDDNFLETINKAAKTISDQVRTRSDLKNANNDLLQSQHNLIVELDQIKASHIKLENHLSDLQTLNEDEIKRLRRIISEMTQCKIDEFENLFQDLNSSINNIVPLQSELSVYRKMLDSEKDRTDNYTLNAPVVKRRKTTSKSSESGTGRKILKATRRKNVCAIM